MRFAFSLAAFAATAALAGPAPAQTAPKGSELTLYSSSNLKGQKRVVTATSPNLGGVDADNFAWSLSTKGRWEVCMDAGHRAGCRTVIGEVRDLGTDGGAITSARYLGPVGQPAAATTPAPVSAIPAVQAPVAAGNRYSTTSGMMTVSRWDATGFAAQYGDRNSRLEGTVSGNTVTGYWMQDSSNQSCPTVRGGTRHWGRFTFNFTHDGNKFDGKWDWCGTTAGDSEWNGTREGGSTSSAPGYSSADQAGLAAATPVPGAVRRVGDAVERRVGDEVERRVGGALGKLLRGN
ncbi:hypothetical protein [Sphingomonas sp.]|uniref:hypothetical protein n=1 Tax=Sphingomonas sp. TaxID=28214 RepID=UPI002DD6A940|nr:hypothetical protein [Sphingomonas sp.]